jgi:hypothetical protein
MTAARRRDVQLDDLNEGMKYVFYVRNYRGHFTGWIVGEFGGFIRERGRPLVVMAVRPGTVYPIPTTQLTRIEG